MYNHRHRDHSWLIQNLDPARIRQVQESLLQINPYQEQQWHTTFGASTWYQDIVSRLPSDTVLIWNRGAVPTNVPTSREFHFTRYFAMSTFYYIQHLVRDDEHSIVDLGCGGNLFRGLVPRLVGIDPYHPAADINDFVDQDFVSGHRDHFSAVMAINSLHFRGLDQFAPVLRDFYSMLAPGGVGLVTFGLGVMVDHTSDAAWHDIFSRPAPETTADTVMTWVDQQLRELAWDFLVVDQYYFNHVDVGGVILSNPVDGNIRIVIRKHT